MYFGGGGQNERKEEEGKVSGSQKHSQDTFQKGIFGGVVCMCKSVEYG